MATGSWLGFGAINEAVLTSPWTKPRVDMQEQAGVPFSLPLMFLTFLKIGSMLYGSGYVLLAFLRSDFVVKYGWLTDQQLLDAIAIVSTGPGC